ncbi:HTH-type transcriptional regulator/antitoxin HigA [Marinobacter sp. LV10R520-4]|uniref:ImmA/IrrE family metallo-endopeptidase n=1 Tax=Marinobacter sp. LV10R520-4 TaxID=1761796 RepID=UPI000BF7F687|nr:ImmA/IrrE family metallo-endopeptidase [Marinobacter sp. LV10R520-4]PFG53356.1 HTH-type transcriptional regulator/antitoxin HigA [Marinobacter sp. LV10R520-4]
MNKDGESFSLDAWEDFSVSSKTSYSSATELYESFKIYKNQLKSLPKSELVKRGWISSKNDTTSLVNLFKEIHRNHDSALYRKSDTASFSLTSLWFSKIKSQAEVSAFKNSTRSFEGIDKNKLRTIAQLSVDVNIITELPKILSNLGIILIYMRSLPSMKLDGVVFKIDSGHPVIGMSLRYSRLDNFWFTLLHELSHIYLHMDLLNNPILENFDIESNSEIEISANRLAKSAIVDRHVWRNCEPKYDKSFEAIEKFSSEIGIHKSVIAGLLRREQGNYSSFSRLVNEINTREVIFGHD